MTRPSLQLRQRLFLLLLAVGGLGVVALLWTLLLANEELFEHVLPEHRVLHDIEAASIELVGRYAAYQYDPGGEARARIDAALARVRARLDDYMALAESHWSEHADAGRIAEALDGIARAGTRMLEARLQFETVFDRQEALEDEISGVFANYLDQINVELASSIDARDLEQMTRQNIPELRMIKSINQQMLQLFLEIREYQTSSEARALIKMARLQRQIEISNTMLEMFIENEAP